MKNLLIVLYGTLALNLFAEIIPYSPGTVIISREHLQDWQVEPTGKDSKAVIRYHGVYFYNYNKNTTGSFALGKKLDNIDCSDFDRFIYEPKTALYHARPKEVISGTIETDIGVLKSLPLKKFKVNGRAYYSPNIEFDVSGAKVIKSIHLEVTLARKGISDGHLWPGIFMLRNTSEHNIYMKHYRRFAKLKWEGLLKAESYQPKFQLQYKILFSNADLEKYRKLYGKYVRTPNVDNIVAPENAILSDIGSGYQTSDISEIYLKYCKHPANWFLRSGSGYAFQALVKKDKKLMRMAARYLLSTATVGAWTEDPRLNTVGGTVWPAFTPSSNLRALAEGLDCAAEMLTPRGRKYILKAMILKGIAPVTYSLWERHYAFKMNQGLSFLSGKTLGLCIMDQVWPRVTPMLETSKKEADECMKHLFNPDGSYMETVGYLEYSILCAIPIYQAYSRNKRQTISQVIPECMKNFGDYAEVIASTAKSHGQVLIPLGQCTSWGNFYIYCSAFLALGCPDSMWVNLYKKISKADKEAFFKKKGSGPRGPVALNLCSLADKLHKVKKLKNFILLKGSGLASSLRELNGKKVKILAVGDAAGVGKKSYDTSSFILEFAGDAFAVQMPVRSGIFFESQFRNMTVPILKNGTYANQKYLLGYRPQSDRNTQCPEAGGNATAFNCVVDASLSWDKAYFKKYIRTINSPSPENITVTDHYQLGNKAAGAAFMLISYLDIQTKDNTAVITGNHGGKAFLSVSDGCRITVEKFTPAAKISKAMNMKAGTKVNRLIISKNGKSGDNDKITVKIKLAAT